jgi:preprotein translocase SecE subunit
MSVAETHVREQTSRNPQHVLAVGSAIGALALLAGVAIVFAILPMGWSLTWDRMFAENVDLKNNVFLSDALLILVELLVVAGLVYGGIIALRGQVQPGVRAGSFFLAVYVFAVLWLCFWIGTLIDNGQYTAGVGAGILIFIGAVLLAGAGYLYSSVPGWMNFLEVVEHQGWFHAYSYKGNQGVRVRRGSIVGLLAVGICGIITLVQHRFFGFERVDLANDFYWIVPFTRGDTFVPLMFKVHLLMPIVLGVLLFWVAWRVVNIPGFADFLIATEAEMNKVSWTNRRRLMADTIVVLTTVFLFTAFLFIVDVIWIKVLSAPGIQVLLIDAKQEAQKQQEKAQW